jgi:hypothetical protein
LVKGLSLEKSFFQGGRCRSVERRIPPVKLQKAGT